MVACARPDHVATAGLVPGHPLGREGRVGRWRVPPRARPALRTPEAALGVVERHGVVLLAARGPVPRLTEEIAGEPIEGSWWSHRFAHEIYDLLGAVTEHADVYVCRAVDGKLTAVHRRCWPALARLAERFDPRALARVVQVHTPSGRHENVLTPFEEWLPAAVRRVAATLDEQRATEDLGAWAAAPTWPARRARSPARGHRNAKERGL